MFLLSTGLLRCYSVRPIFLGCCVLAVKVSREGDLSLSNLLNRVRDVFTLLDDTLGLDSLRHNAIQCESFAPVLPDATKLK